MIQASELKRGIIVDIDKSPHIVEQLTVQTPSARGSATLYKVRFRDLHSKQKADRTFRGDDVLREVDFERHEAQFLYRQQDLYTFMDLETYEQVTFEASAIEESQPYLVEGMEGILALIADGRVLGIELPPVVELVIAQCDPYMRGASATGRNKPATLVTGLVIQVPEYMSEGERVRVDTRTGLFVSRA